MRQNVVNYQFWIYCQFSWSIFFYAPCQIEFKTNFWKTEVAFICFMNSFSFEAHSFPSFCYIDKIWQWCFIMKKWIIVYEEVGIWTPPSMAWKNLKLLLVNHWWPKPSGGGGVVNGASCGTQWLIQLPFCRFTEKFNICSCHRTDADIFEPPTKSAKWYFVILWHFGSYCRARYFPDGTVARFTSHSYPTKSVTI